VVLAVLLGLAGAAAAAVLGLLTFGAQATARPDHVPLAVATPPTGPAAGQLRSAAERVAGQGGDAVSWRVVTPEEGRNLLSDKEVYGVLELATDASGTGLATIVVVSGAVNPQGTQFAQQILTGAGQALGAALAQATPGVQVAPVQTITVQPASIAARIAPLAASALLWVGGFAAALAFGLLTIRKGVRIGAGSRALLAATVSVLAVAVVAGLMLLWDSTLTIDVPVLGFLLLAAVAFAAVQGALLRLLRLRAVAIIGPLYLIAPAVAGQVPELLNPVYRALLWSWTPFRFSTEGLRSLLQGTPSAPDVATGVIVLATMAVVGLLILLWPRRQGSQDAVTEPADSVGGGAVSHSRGSSAAHA
jgi:hypothetical protein